jgi:hypothetical protein
MMKVRIHSFSMPRWILPALFLAVLALIPFALILGLTLAATAVGLSVLRLLMPTSDRPAMGAQSFPPERRVSGETGIIDAEYEVKEDHGEK